MMTAAVMRQLRILEIIILCFLAKTLEGKSIKTQNDRAKRGLSHYGGNDFGAAEHVSSAVLQYGSVDEHAATLDSGSYMDSSAISAGHSGSLDSSKHFDTYSVSSGHSGGLDAISHFDAAASNGGAWSAAGGSSGYDVWLEPLPNYDGSSSHPTSDHIANTVFSDDTAHSVHFGLPGSQLHTHISSSIGNSAVNIGGSIHDHGTVAISDNIDFSNVADVKSKHYAKSYGK